MTYQNGEVSIPFSRRQLIHRVFGLSLGLGLLSSLLSEPAEALPLFQLSASASPDTPNQAPITVTIHFTAKANKTDTLVNHLTQALPDTRNAPGCRYAQLYVISGNPNQVVLFKGWDSEDAQANYLKWEQSSGRLDQLLALVEGDPIVEYWDYQVT